MTAQIGEPRTGGKVLEHQLLGNAGQHGLAAMREIAQPRGPIDSWSDVVAFIAEPYLAGVHADPKPDRSEWSLLQFQRTRHSVSRAGERDHEAVAFALFHRPNPAVRRDEVRQAAI